MFAGGTPGLRQKEKIRREVRNTIGGVETG
jgi:hypothetical protein